MCGISGEFNFEGQLNQPGVRQMMEAQSHRGRRNNKMYRVNDTLAVGFNYLPIQDPKSEPIAEIGVWKVWMNGEIYNHLELRKDLSLNTFKVESCVGPPVEFSSDLWPNNLDTTTIAAGLHKDGTEFIKKLNGIFAIVAYNTETETLYIFRDRFGAKQIYYHHNGDALLFASEPKAFLKHPGYTFAVNKDAVGQWLVFQNNFSGETLFEGVKLLRKGSMLVCTREGNMMHKSFHDFEYSGNEVGNLEEIDKRIYLSCRAQQPNEDFAVWLSGGLDSSILARYMSPSLLVTAGWAEADDERKDSELISKDIKALHMGLVFNKKHMMLEMENTIRSLDDLRAGQSWSNYLINKTISKHVRISVQGTGADELFGGYTWRYQANDYVNILDKSKMPERFLLDTFRIPKIPQDIFERYKWDIDHFLNGLLIVGDRLSMAFGIEERVPFLDNNLAEIALKLNPNSKLHKHILRHATKSYGISEVKRGFGSPDKLWMSDPEVQDHFRKEIKSSPYLPQYVDMDMIDGIIEARNFPAVWSLLALHYWLKIYADGK